MKLPLEMMCASGRTAVIYAAGHAFDRNGGQQALSTPVRYISGIMSGSCGHVSIVSGVNIGDNTIIAAGSVVVNDIPPNVLAGGNPCR